VLVAGQIPVADLRKFVIDETHALTAPSWPSPAPGREFVRSFGGVKPRMRGGIGPWVGEEAFCDAHHAVRFPGGARWWDLGGVLEDWPFFGWAYRRLLSDGRGVTRVEVGISNWWPLGAYGPEVGVEVISRACATGQLELKETHGGWSSAALLQAGPLLTPLLLRSTTKFVPGGVFSPNKSWIRDGQPVFLVEYGPLEHEGKLPGRAIPLSGMSGIELSVVPSQEFGVYFRTWFLRVDPAADPDAVRRIRVHLLRIHAERECLRRVLEAIIDDTVTVERGVEATDCLQEYLNNVLSRLFKPSYQGIRQAEVLEAAYESDGIIGEAEMATLLAKLEEIRGNVRRKLEKLAEGYFIVSGDASG
jgi:hypothetical protein